MRGESGAYSETSEKAGHREVLEVKDQDSLGLVARTVGAIVVE